MERLEYLRVEDVAKQLKLGRSTVYALIQQHRIPHIRIGTAVRIPKEAFETWLREQIHDPRSQKQS